ncbi:MAG: hypothetical protein IJO39_06350 [Clostridia bacterium]|nr:hypothetical protein [Clostridia bacterium]
MSAGMRPLIDFPIQLCYPHCVCVCPQGRIYSRWKDWILR